MLTALGEWRADALLLHEAIGTLQAALDGLSREDWPLEWARAQSGLGGAFEILGGSEDSEANLLKSVGAFEAALKVFGRAEFPTKWAETMINLGASLSTFGRDTPKFQVSEKGDSRI